ncbi:hypothetical protein H6P81_005575 [Aristolochia fimbriata]|uniref:Uncharacterized protein n=1 Tax=Aristolochia fimbriata TaxID=158543 RepID=A0AAV7EYK8_ARIFI|nr:hypothetical protein H6P81_005575 [Aristolochia fimbriata]
MGSTKASFPISFLVLNLILSFSAAVVVAPGPYDAIYSFGDSIADTGNLMRGPGARPPYGETYFRRPTGRCSDGRLMIDFIAQRFGLPLVKPYLGGGPFVTGANFAVAGATALDAGFLRSRGINPPTANSLNVQLGWFENHLGSICRTPEECNNRLGRALFLLGEIGGNDYNDAFFQGKPMSQVDALVPAVVQTIRAAATRLISHGARRLIVPGNFPIGCVPSYLASFPGPYDQRGCLSYYNEFSERHNAQLQQMLQGLRMEFPYVRIQYADYYHAMLEVLDNAPRLGFTQRFRACCGVGGVNNYNGGRMCGTPGTTLCPDPSRYISWDGIHMTERTYGNLADTLFRSYLRG